MDASQALDTYLASRGRLRRTEPAARIAYLDDIRAIIDDRLAAQLAGALADRRRIRTLEAKLAEAQAVAKLVDSLRDEVTELRAQLAGAKPTPRTRTPRKATQ